MANVVPTGLPAWTHTASIDVYGGHIAKQNHLGGGVIDATTDVGAEDFSRLVGDLAAAVRSAPFAILVLKLNDGTSAAPTVQSARMMTGVNLVPYAGSSPPVGYPTVTRPGTTGQALITLASSYNDEYGIAGTFAVRDAQATVQGSSNYTAVCEIVDATHVLVRVLNGATPVADQTVTVVIG